MNGLLLSICFFILFCMKYPLNAMGECSEKALTVESVNFAAVDIPDKLSYLDGKITMQRILPENYKGLCNNIRSDICGKIETNDCLYFLYKLLPNFIWENQSDECHVLAEVTRGDGDRTLRCAIKALCAIYYFKPDCLYHICSKNTFIISDELISKKDAVCEIVASALCMMLGIFEMSLHPDLRVRFIDQENKSINPISIFDCGHINEAKVLKSEVCTMCKKRVKAALSCQFNVQLGDVILHSMQDGQVPLPAVVSLGTHCCV